MNQISFEGNVVSRIKAAHSWAALLLPMCKKRKKIKSIDKSNASF